MHYRVLKGPNMTPIGIRLLHVEDDRIQQALLTRQLGALQDYRFDITVVTSEDEALAVFPRGGFELVIVDYRLVQGDGVSCLRRIRQIDSIVPIVAVSSVATDENAAELISAGADDYLAKQTLDAKILGQSVRNVLTRATAFRARFATLGKPIPTAPPLGGVEIR
jgi:CheY-like chemotaxis protein